MSTATPVSLKILTVGPAVGSIRELFAKVKAIDAKHGKFEFLLCIGDFFGPVDVENPENETRQLLEGRIDVPMPCYIMQGDQALPQQVVDKFAASGSEIYPNIFLMSKSGILTTSHGLRIACLGGVYEHAIYNTTEAPLGFSDPFFSTHTIERLLSNISTTSTSNSSKPNTLAALKEASISSHLIDILISHAWPASIPALTSTPFPHEEISLAPPVDDIIRRAKPKYHFATGAGKPPQFWERDPFLWDEEEGRVTRFISLGAFGGEQGAGKKPRWFYAFSITPSTSTTTTQPRPIKVTMNPFMTSSSIHKRPLETSEGENFIFGSVHHPGKRRRNEDKGVPGKPPPGYKCRKCESPEHFISDCPERTKPPEGYVCKICNEPGHLVRDCPTKHTPGDTGGRKPPPGYVCRACASELHLIQDCPVAAQSQRGPRGAKGKGPPREIAPDECWFCLSNPRLAKHLIVSIGSECYLTLPKGQIIPTGESVTKDVSPVPGGGHVLIVPITHYPTLNSIPADLSQPIVDEVEKYKSALRAMYAKHGAVAVTFEVSILSGKGGHAHVQVVPVPSKFKDQVEGAFLREGQHSGISFEADADEALVACAGGRGNYFRVDLPDGRKMVHLVREGAPFGIQFGRHVLCNLLGMSGRMDWKACMQSDEEERADAQTFKVAFAPFDTTQS